MRRGDERDRQDEARERGVETEQERDERWKQKQGDR